MIVCFVRNLVLIRRDWLMKWDFFYHCSVTPFSSSMILCSGFQFSDYWFAYLFLPHYICVLITYYICLTFCSLTGYWCLGSLLHIRACVNLLFYTQKSWQISLRIPSALFFIQKFLNTFLNFCKYVENPQFWNKLGELFRIPVKITPEVKLSLLTNTSMCHKTVWHKGQLA